MCHLRFYYAVPKRDLLNGHVRVRRRERKEREMGGISSSLRFRLAKPSTCCPRALCGAACSSVWFKDLLRADTT